MKIYYNRGWNDFSNGKLITDNPYKKGSAAYIKWNEGWKDHYRDLSKYVSVFN